VWKAFLSLVVPAKALRIRAVRQFLFPLFGLSPPLLLFLVLLDLRDKSGTEYVRGRQRHREAGGQAGRQAGRQAGIVSESVREPG
jgi:hypothetical protein